MKNVRTFFSLFAIIGLGIISLGYIAPSQFPTNPAAPTGTTTLLNVDGGLTWGAASSLIAPGAANTVYESDGGVAYFGTVPAVALTPGAANTVYESDGGVAYTGQVPVAAFVPGAVNTVYESDGGVAYAGPLPAAAMVACANGQFVESDGGTNFCGPISGGDVTCSTSTAGNCTVGTISGSTPILITPSVLQWTAATTVPEITQTSTSLGTGATLEIQAQGATGGGNNGGNLLLASGTSGSATVGAVQLACGSTTVEQLGQATSDFLKIGPIPATAGAIRLSNAEAIEERNGANSADVNLISMNSSNAFTVGDITNGASGSSIQANGSQLLFQNSVIRVSATFALLAGISGDTVGGAQPFRFVSATATLSHGGTTNAGVANAYLAFTDTGLTSNAVIAFGTNSKVTGNMVYVDTTGVTFGGHTITITINGNTWGTTISAAAVDQLIYNGTQFYGVALTP